MNTNRLHPLLQWRRGSAGWSVITGGTSREHEGAGLVSLRPENESTSRPGRAVELCRNFWERAGIHPGPRNRSAPRRAGRAAHGNKERRKSGNAHKVAMNRSQGDIMMGTIIMDKCLLCLHSHPRAASSGAAAPLAQPLLLRCAEPPLDTPLGAALILSNLTARKETWA